MPRPGHAHPRMDERLGVRTIRGHKSPGMLCSAIELGVGEDADGILILDDGPPGQPLAEVLTLDTVLDLDITTNRPDCLCHVGIARELAAALGEALNEPPSSVPDELLSATSAELRAQVRIEDPDGCPRFAARVIEGIVVGPVARVAAAAPRAGRAATDQQRGGRHQLRPPRARGSRSMPLTSTDSSRWAGPRPLTWWCAGRPPASTSSISSAPIARSPRKTWWSARRDAGEHRGSHRRQSPPR